MLRSFLKSGITSCPCSNCSKSCRRDTNSTTCTGLSCRASRTWKHNIGSCSHLDDYFNNNVASTQTGTIFSNQNISICSCSFFTASQVWSLPADHSLTDRVGGTQHLQYMHAMLMCSFTSRMFRSESEYFY